MNKFETIQTDEITCPYCGYVYKDSWEEPNSGEVECCECEKKFLYERNITCTYTTLQKN